ncbi:hypothetical protein ACFP3Q_06045 [Nocardioides sp. GCM10027113]|uniref:hypothetical protein n=1 Tax=unclassified Nocardioides TaxID=2615069 RepID=UPI0036196B52
MHTTLTRRPVRIAAAVVAATAVTLPPPAAAASRVPVEFTDTRLFTSDTGQVTTSLAECPTATSVDVMARAAFTGSGSGFLGVFVGVRDIQCDQGGGFVVRLSARFGQGGSVGSWSVVDSYGSLAGLRGAGSLVGEPLDAGGVAGIADHYTGTLTRTR